MAMLFNEHNAFKLLSELSFPRVGGTKEEKKAASILKKYLKSIGLKSKEETFKTPTYEEISASLEVSTPYIKKYKAAVMGNTGSTPANGIKGELVHLLSASSEHLKETKNKIVILYNSVLNKNVYQKLMQMNVKALIRVMEATRELHHLKQNDLFSKAYGKMPSIILDYEDALELIHKGVKYVTIKSKQKEFVATSQNVISTIIGTDFPNEKIIICGHYDSVTKSPGSIDNAGGSVTIAEFARYFSEHPPKRTIIFIWFGSEELGLKGSWAYRKQHEFELTKPGAPLSIKTQEVKMVINVDVAGTIFGANGAIICGHETIANFVDGLAKEKGLQMNISHGAYSSDNIPFNEKGIPSISLHRASGNFGHTPLDNMRLMGPEGLKLLGQFGLELVNRIANATEIPFNLSIPDPDKKQIYEYVERANPFYRR
jgi:acetylornithine deacetylase/succinyl-diaminopimelate desuccinylase-like protein